VRLVPWIVALIHVFEAERSDGRYLSYVLAGFCPVEVPRIAGQHDHAALRISLDLVAIELLAQPDVENAGPTV
jgi:hypothetical protein